MPLHSQDGQETSDAFDDDIPLQRISISSESITSDQEHLLGDDGILSEKALPAVDTSLAAWRFLFGTWLIEAFLWGFPLAFGIFQFHYSQHPLFSSSKHIPTIGAMATGVSYLGILFVNPIALRYPHFQRHITVLGWSMCILGLIGASFATQVWHLILFQGVFYGVGWVVCYTPFLILLNQWFDKKRGLAYGILFGASGISGLFLPFLLEALLHRFGFRTTLRAFAVATALCSGPGLLMIKPRIPPAMISRKPGRNNHAFLRNPLVYVFAASILLQGLAFFLPNIFLPSYALALNLPPSSGDLLLAITSLAQVTCQIALGHFSDKASIHLPSHACALISGLAVLLLWGPARDFGRLAAFAALWGATAGSYSVLWTRVAAVLAPGPEETQTLYGWFSFERGVANVLCGPIAAVLLGEEVDAARYGLGRYAGVVGFTGGCLLVSSLGVVAWWWDREEKSGRERVGRLDAGIPL